MTDPRESSKAKKWFDKTTADYWRHARGYRIIEPLDRNTSWLTVGDGRWGLDSLRIRDKGFTNVLPSDLAPSLLQKSKEYGYIDDYLVQNAEKMTLPDESYDYVFCKEAFHHFPRPYLALYEMLRVARKGVVLTEPNDRSDSVVVEYEPVGNYTFLLNIREMTKIALAMYLPAICYGGYNDFYIEGCEFEPSDESKSSIFRKIRQVIAEQDQLVHEGKMDYGMVSMILFKILPSESEIAGFRKLGCNYVELPRR